MSSIILVILPLLCVCCWAILPDSFRRHLSEGSSHRRYDLGEYSDTVENTIEQTVHHQIPSFLRRWDQNVVRKFPSLPDRPNFFQTPAPHSILPPRRPSSSEAREALFRGTEKGRLVPMNASALMPDRCLLHPFVQTIGHEGCDNVTLKNHLCYGLCSSLFVPTDDSDPITTCTKCAPSDQQSVAIELHCTGKEPVRKYVKVVKACSCIACSTRDFNG